MNVETARFGSIAVDPAEVFRFNEGLPGIAGREFVRLDEAPGVEWLQSVSAPETALLLVEPRLLVPDYAPLVRPEDVRALVGRDADPASLECRIVVRSGERPGQLLLNLFAPIFFARAERRAVQLPLVGTRYRIQEPWPLGAEAPPAEPSDDEDEAEPSDRA